MPSAAVVVVATMLPESVDQIHRHPGQTGLTGVLHSVAVLVQPDAIADRASGATVEAEIELGHHIVRGDGEVVGVVPTEVGRNGVVAARQGRRVVGDQEVAGCQAGHQPGEPSGSVVTVQGVGSQPGPRS